MGKFGVGGFKNKKSLTVLETASFWPFWSQNDVVYGLFFFFFWPGSKRRRFERWMGETAPSKSLSKRRRFDLCLVKTTSF